MRAALALDPAGDLNEQSPLAFFGVSQGGQAAAAVAELLPSYGGELVPQVRGVVAGGVVTDMQEQAAFSDGNPILAGVGLWRAALAKSKLGTVAPRIPT